MDFQGFSFFLSLSDPPPPKKPFEEPAERKRKRKEKLAALHRERNELRATDWDPHSNPKATASVTLSICSIYLLALFNFSSRNIYAFRKSILSLILAIVILLLKCIIVINC